MATIVKNNGGSTWTLADTNPQVVILAAGQLNLETLLSQTQIAASNQLLQDVANVSLSLVVNDGSQDLTTSQALNWILNKPNTGPTTSTGAPIVQVTPQDQTTVDGYTTTAATSFVVIRPSAYVEPTANAQRSVDSSSVNDTSAGTGARTIRITYFDVTMAGPFTETITLNGTAKVNTVATNICFVERIDVMTVGSSAGNEGTIRLYAAAAGAGGVVGQLEIGDNETNWCHHYIASGKTAKITDVVVTQTGAVGGKIHLRRATPTVANTPEYTIAPVLRAVLNGSYHYAPTTPISVAGPARVALYVRPDSATSTDYNAGFSYFEQ